MKQVDSCKEKVEFVCLFFIITWSVTYLYLSHFKDN